MSKKPKELLTDFSTVSNTNISTDIDTNVNTNTEMERYVPPIKVPRKQVTVYLDEDVIEAYNRFGAEIGKGAKSDLVNNYLKKYFNIRQGE